MSEYLRSTRHCTLENMQPVLASAIRSYIDKNGLVLPASFPCYETTSTKQKKGLFGGKPETILTGVVLTAQSLIVATRKGSEAPAVLSIKLSDIRVQEYEKSDMYKLMPDTGLNLTGLPAGLDERGSLFIGLGSEPAAQEFRAALKAVVERA